MKSHVRASVAAISISHSLGRKVSSVYSYGDGGYTNINASIQGNRVDGYDYSNGCHFGGSIPSLYHYGEGHHIALKPNREGKYSGYDYGSGHHFDVTVKGTSAELYDYDGSGYHSYST